ncbi:TonB-dependent receptor [Sphingomonas oryzagri]
MRRGSPTNGRARTFLAVSCIGAALVPAGAIAQSTDAPASQEKALGGVTVTDTAIYDAPGNHLESPKRTRSVRDTPQTITVLSAEVLEQQNLLGLKDALSTVPGITFGAGEGGGGYGDSINFRGYSANTDITVDGVRDSAQYNRSDSFDTDQIEVTNGANSVISGVGSVGGSINIVSKNPLAKDEAILSGGVGTANYYRGTADINKRVDDLIAVRLNAMYHRNDVPGRDVENNNRWGIAPAVTIGIDSPTRLTLAYLHQEDHNIPQYGVPYFNGPVPGVDRSDYFGYRNLDTQRINVDRFTMTFDHEFSDTTSIRNLARWQDVRQRTIVDPPQGTYCLADGVSSAGGVCAYPGYYQPSGPRGNERITDNQLMFDQLDLKSVFSTGPIEHTIDFGGAVSWEKFHLSTGNVLRNVDGSAATLPLIDFTNPNELATGLAGFAYGSNVWTGPVNFIESARQTGELTNYAAYLFDTMKLGRVEFSGGVRVERNEGTYRADTVSTTGGTLGQVTVGDTFRNADTLLSYRLGLTYKPIESVSLYVAYGNSQTPSKNAVNGSCTAATCDVDPASAKNYEIGAKAQLLDGLLLTVAAFRNERDKYLVASNDPAVPDQQLDGKSRVDGIAVGASGRVTKSWTITANYTYLKSKLIRSVSSFCLENPGSAGCANSVVDPDPGAGSLLTQTPKNSGSLFTTYKLPFGLSVGYGATYQGSFAFNTPTLAAPTVLRAKSYWIHQAYFAYDFTRTISAQINVKNFTNAHYYTRIRNNGWATSGDARSAVFTLNVSL